MNLKLTPPEDLSREQRALIQELLKHSGTTGVLTGVAVGAAEWDLRPLVLERGLVAILRIFDPAALADAELSQTVQRTCDLFNTLYPNFASGTFVSQHRAGLSSIWQRRPFFPEVLADRLAISNEHKDDLARRILNLVRTCHRKGVVHGHITPRNLAFTGDNLVLLDASMAATSVNASNQLSDLAPELRNHQIQSPSLPILHSDLYGIGVTFQFLYANRSNNVSNSLTADRSRGIEDLLVREPHQRPRLDDIEQIFFPGNRFNSTGVGRVITRSNALLVEKSADRTAVTGAEVPSHKTLIAGTKEGVISETNPESTPGRLGLDPSNAKPDQKLDRDKGLNLSLIKQVVIDWISKIPYWASLIVAIVLIVIWKNYSYIPINDVPFEAYWGSNQPSLMKEVADAAVSDNNRDAQNVIVEAALAGRGEQYIRLDLIRRTFDPRWESELTDEDRALCLRMALGPLLSRTAQAAKLPSKLSPGALLALLSVLQPAGNGGQFSIYSIQSLATLPDPIGRSFAALEPLQLSDVETPTVRGLAHLIFGDISNEVISAFFAVDDSTEKVLLKLSVLLPLIQTQESLANAVFNHLDTKVEAAGALLNWFKGQSIADWREVAGRDKIILAAGVFPTNTLLSFERIADLLVFPRKSVREAAMAIIRNDKGLEALESLIVYLASSKNRLTRNQSISLLASLGNKGSDSYSFLQKWFQSQPDPQAVVELLIIRRTVSDSDSFQLEASRYLVNKLQTLILSPEQLKLLANHPDPLTRGLAYLKLSPLVPAERAILEEALSHESVERMREQLSEKLSSSTE